MRRSAPRLTSPISLLPWAALISSSSPGCDAALTVSLNVSGQVSYGEGISVTWAGGSGSSYQVGVEEQEGSHGDGDLVLLTDSTTGEYDYPGFSSGAWGQGHFAFYVESEDDEGWSELITLTSSIATSTSTSSSSSTLTPPSTDAAVRAAAPATSTTALADSTSSSTTTSSAASASSTSSSHLSTGSAISVGIGLGVAGMAALVGLLFYVYRRGIMAAARGDYRHKEVPSDDPYPQQQQPLPQKQPPGSSVQASPNFASGYASAATYGNPHHSMPPPPSAAGMASPPFRYSMPPEAAYHQTHDAAYAPPPPPPESMYQPSEATTLQPPDAMFQQQQRARSGSYAGSLGPGEVGNGIGGGGMDKLPHPQAAVAPAQLLVAELDREPSRPYAELDPSPRYIAELSGGELPVAYAELPGGRENSRQRG